MRTDFAPRLRPCTGRAAGPALEIQHEPRRVFERLLDADEEGHRLPAVDDAVVVAESARYIIGRISTLPPTATGRSWILCMPRMPDCGALRIGVDISEP